MQLHSFCTPNAMQIFWFALHGQKRSECIMSEYQKNTLRVFKLISHTIKTAKMRLYFIEHKTLNAIALQMLCKIML